MAARKTVPVDLDLDALEKEALSSADTSGFTFRIHGHVLTMSIGENSDFRVLDALAKDNLTLAVSLLLGEEQYAKFTEKPVSMRTLKALLDGWYKAKGTTTGE